VKGVESSFLESWKGWDEIDSFDLQFYKPVYKRGVGIPDEVIELAGEESCFAVLSSASVVEIYNKEGESIFSAKVKLVIE
jgi:hypothetical protein